MLSCNIALDIEVVAKTDISSGMYHIDILTDINFCGD